MVDMEVITPSGAAVDFNFDSACTSPYISAPSSPQRFGNFFFSAPTSPTRASTLYREFNNSFYADTAGADALANSGIPFNWEEKPGTPKKRLDANNSFAFKDEATEFAFDFSGHLERTSLSADELFDGGKIKPLKPPPRLQYPEARNPDSPKSPKNNKNVFREAFSPRKHKEDADPFAAAIEQTCREDVMEPKNDRRGRDRERATANDLNSKSTGSHKATRSLSPFRASDLLFDSKEEEQEKDDPKQSSSTSSSRVWGVSTWYRNWKLKDLLLFRSTSEGRGLSKFKDPLKKKYALLKKSHQEEDVKNLSFRSVDSCGSTSSSRRRGAAVSVSAHQLHYTANRAVSEEMRKKTFLPYRPALLGCLSFNPPFANT